jgi:hypothetical protein
MSNEKHSPGPWHWERDTMENHHQWALVTADGWVVAERGQAPGQNERDAANCRLIAAAPTTKDRHDELLALLRRYLDDHVAFVDPRPGSVLADARDLRDRIDGAGPPEPTPGAMSASLKMKLRR